MKLVYSREHVCHNAPMIWQPAGRHFYCQTCHRKEGPGEYGTGTVAHSKPNPPIVNDGIQLDQPELEPA